MDTFDVDVDNLMRYDALKEDWEATREADPAEDKPPDAGAAARVPPPDPPHPTSSTPTCSTIIVSPDIEALRRGQRLEFAHGARKWCAVYWGKDDEGHVIAHKTFKDWALTHIDLNQYVGKLSAESEPDRELVQSIDQHLCECEGREA